MRKDNITLPVYSICSPARKAPLITVEKALMDSICTYLSEGSDGRERGGVFGLSADNGSAMVNFIPDVGAETTACSYKLSAEVLEEFVSRCPDGTCFGGMIHTHKKMKELSRGDFEYIKAFFESNPEMKQLIAGVFTREEAKLYLYGFERAAFFAWYRSGLSAYLRRVSDSCRVETGASDRTELKETRGVSGESDTVFRRKLPDWFTAIVKDKLNALEKGENREENSHAVF